MNSYIPEMGKTCPAMSNEDYEYHLSGDCGDYCHCMITGKACLGRTIEDPEDASSRFVSRAKCMIDPDKLNRCPLLGAPKPIFAEVVKAKTEAELANKLANFN